MTPTVEHTIGAQAGFVRFSESVAELKSAAGKGVELDPASAQALISSLEAAKGEANSAMLELTRANVDELPIGESPAGQLYKPTFSRSANDPTQGGITAYKQLKREIDDVIATVKQCVKDTQTNEERTAGAFGKLYDI